MKSALIHIFRVTSGLDSLVLGEPQIVIAGEGCMGAGTNGRRRRTFSECGCREGSERFRAECASETAIGKLAVSIPTAALDLARQIFGSLEGRQGPAAGHGKDERAVGAPHG